MNSMIREIARTPFFKQILEEWRIYLANVAASHLFATLYLELMRDPEDNEGRWMATQFVNYTQHRSWKRVFACLRPELEPHVLQAFEGPGAAAFFETWRAMVIQQIHEYWTAFVAAQKKDPRFNPKDWSPRGEDGIPRADE